MDLFARVVLPIPSDIEFDYSFSDTQKVAIGSRVLVDFSNRNAIGIVTSIAKESTLKRLKAIAAVLDDSPVLSAGQIEFARELKKHYPYTLGEFLFMMLPQVLKRTARVRYPGDIGNGFSAQTKKTFIQGVDFLSRYWRWRQMVKEALAGNSSVMVTFPQNSYLAAAVDIMRKDFPDLIVLSGEDEPKEFFAHWQRSRKNSLIVGTRIAFFNYPPDLGLLIVEDETNRSYFHEEKPFYNLPDVARRLSTFKKIPLILSGDFPALATYQEISEGKSAFIPADMEHGSVSEVIGKGEYAKSRLIGPLFIELLRKSLADKKRVAVIWNKKGFAYMLRCDSCGNILKCDHCSAFLRPFGQNNSICPYCAKKYPFSLSCAQCHKGYVKPAGLGLERVAGLIKKNFPSVSISLAGSRTLSQVTMFTSAILSSLYGQKEYDTGFILDADSFLGYADFNAGFDAFIYLKKLNFLFKDKFYIFTSHLAHHLFTCLKGDWRKFYDIELEFRKKLRLPPFARVVKIILRLEDADILLKRVEQLYNDINAKGFEVYGPFEESPFKLRGKFRYSLTVKLGLTDSAVDLFAQIKAARGSKIKLAAIVSG